MDRSDTTSDMFPVKNRITSDLQLHYASDSSSCSYMNNSFINTLIATTAPSSIFQVKSVFGSWNDDAFAQDKITHTKLRRLQQMFTKVEAFHGRGMDMHQFRVAMRSVLGNQLTRDELDIIFMKVDTNCDNYIDWHEYLTYTLMECTGKDTMNLQTGNPFPRYMRLIKSEHRDSIIQIIYVPAAASVPISKAQEDDGSLSPMGRYFTVTKDGELTNWTLNMRETYKRRIEPVQPTSKSVWVTDMISLPGVNTIAMSTTSQDITFYDIGSNRFEKASRIVGLDACPSSLSVSSVVHRPYVMLFMWGDDHGGVSIILFEECPLLTAINPKRSQRQFRDVIKFDVLCAGKLQYLKGLYMPLVHVGAVKTVTYSPDLECFISCSKDNENSMFVGDVERKVVNTYFSTRRGVNTFAYFRKVNVIITGGYDGIVRIWSPYKNMKPSFTMQGHTSPVQHIRINAIDDYVITIGENSEIRVFDFDSQMCIQTFYKKMLPKMGTRPITACFFHQANKSLLVGTKWLAIAQHRQEINENDGLVSHQSAVNKALYNPLFRQVVSAGADSLVNVWSLATGKKVMQFYAYRVVVDGEYVDVEITAMSFDETMRRLITGSKNGQVRVWNFNNGMLLRELPMAKNEGEIVRIICFNTRILTAGWNRRITMYYDKDANTSVTSFEPIHREDIMGMELCPQLKCVASCTYDGDIYLWSIETNRVVLVFNHVLSRGPILPDMHSPLAAAVAAANVAAGRSIGVSSAGGCDGGTSGSVAVSLSTVHTCVGTDSGVPLVVEDTQKEAKQADRDVDLAGTSTPSVQDRVIFKRRKKTATQQQPNETECEANAPSPTASREARLIQDKMDAPLPGVEQLIFVRSREIIQTTASLFAACSDGYIRAWAVNHSGGLRGEFFAARNTQYVVLAMATTKCDEFLITGDSAGYVRVWDISHYCIKDCHCSREVDNAREKYWSKYLYVEWMRKIRRNKISPDIDVEFTVGDDSPHLINSFRGHISAVTSVDNFCLGNGQQMLLTASTDWSVRLWTMNGEFIGIFGQIWNLHNAFSEDCKDRIIPTDVRKVASATSLRVLNGGYRSKYWTGAEKMIKILQTQKNSYRKVADSERERVVRIGLEVEAKLRSTTVIDLSERQHWSSKHLGHTCNNMRLTHHRPLPDDHTGKPLLYIHQCVPYRSLNYFNLEPTEQYPLLPTITDIQSQYQLPPLTDTPQPKKRHKRTKTLHYDNRRRGAHQTVIDQATNSRSKNSTRVLPELPPPPETMMDVYCQGTESSSASPCVSRQSSKATLNSESIVEEVVEATPVAASTQPPRISVIVEARKSCAAVINSAFRDTPRASTPLTKKDYATLLHDNLPGMIPKPPPSIGRRSFVSSTIME